MDLGGTMYKVTVFSGALANQSFAVDRATLDGAFVAHVDKSLRKPSAPPSSPAIAADSPSTYRDHCEPSGRHSDRTWREVPSGATLVPRHRIGWQHRRGCRGPRHHPRASQRGTRAHGEHIIFAVCSPSNWQYPLRFLYDFFMRYTGRHIYGDGRNSPIQHLLWGRSSDRPFLGYRLFSIRFLRPHRR
jgi:hypothetical protein